MALIANLYQDWLCTTPAKTFSLGVAGVTGQYAQLNQWQQRGSYLPLIDGNQYYFYQLNAYDNMGFTLGGGSTLYDYDFPSQIPYSVNVPTDTDNQNSSTKIYNPLFTGRGGVYQGTTVAFTLSLVDFDSPNYQGTKYFTIRMYNYSQVPDSGTRTSWNYRNSSMMFEDNAPMPANTAYPLIKIFQITIESKKFYMLACGVSGSNALHPAGTGQPTTLFLIPEIYWKDQPNSPYIGPVSKDSAESSFIPDRGLIHDSIASRDLTGKKNPYGFNSGALKLCKLTNTAYGLLCAQIFNGSSGSILNQLSQDVAAITGGNEHRNHEEVQAIQAGIMKIHLIPDITTIPTGTGYNICTIAGYKISGLVPVPATPITDSMLVYNTASVRILRTWKSYIDFEPYTTITLRIPYVGNVNIPPSIIYDNAVSLTYHLDLFSGTLSVDIIIHDYTNGNSYIFSTLQANCAVSLPIAGTAAAGAPLLKIASGLLGAAMSDVGASANNIFSVISGLQDTKKSVPFGNFAQSNISAYFDSRHCYAIIQSVNPSNAESFLTDKGYVAHLSGTVNDFAGSGTEMHCRFESVDLTGLSKLTEQEKQEVESMLKAGVHIRKA